MSFSVFRFGLRVNSAKDLEVYIRMIELIINGNKFNGRKGETVLEVCRREGIYIPTLCYQEELKPYGGCRLCIVEIEGDPRPITACTLPVENGMVIKTDTPLLKELRKFTLQLILSEHPSSCLICEKKRECASYMECIEKEPITFGCKYCPKNGDCELQKLVEEFDIKEIPFQFSYRNIPIEDYDPFFERDYNLCILCGRCVRACAELRGAYVIDFHHRGPKTLIGTFFNLPHLDSVCQFCGACVDACPTGAMRERYNKYLGRAERRIKTHCMLCSIGCPINAQIKGGQVIGIIPDEKPLCVRGRFGIAPLINHPKRITAPLLKMDGRMIEIDWERAIDQAAKTLKEYHKRTGIIFSPFLTIEAINSLTTIAEIMGVENFGVDVDTIPEFESLCVDKKDKRVGLIAVNTDLIQDFVPFFLEMKRALNKPPVLIAIDSIKTNFAEMADIWLRPFPGNEREVLEILLSDKKPYDAFGVRKQEFIEARRLLLKREKYVIYEPQNINSIPKIDGVRYLPLISFPNHSLIANAKISDSSEIFKNNELECLYLIGANFPKKNNYKRIIVQDCFIPDFDFDLFLPAASFIETEGSFIDIMDKEKRLKKVIEPMGNSKPDEWIIKKIAEGIDFETPQAKRLKLTKKEKKMIAVNSQYPFRLLVRNNNYRFRNKTLAELLKGFKRIHPDRCVWINPKNAEMMQITNNSPVRLVGSDFEVIVDILITEKVPKGVLFAYYDENLKLVENCAVRIERLKE